MEFIAGVNRQPMQLLSMYDAMSQDNRVRLMCIFENKKLQ